MKENDEMCGIVLVSQTKHSLAYMLSGWYGIENRIESKDLLKKKKGFWWNFEDVKMKKKDRETGERKRKQWG